MDLLKLLDERLVSVLDRYSLPGQHVGTDLLELIKNSDAKELIVPVLGMQGMGKSTLINAILKEDILPNEADETTCVPVEVKYGETEEAKVFFLGSDSPVIVHTKAELYEFADNNVNPGNSKKVERIVLYRKNDLLKSGITIVDLPGVGSLTKVNEETTKRYVQNLSTALFVIPTVPTIRKTEAIFIKSVWAQFPIATFVQNRWAGETQQVVDESVPYNTMRLEQIAEQLHNPFDKHIIVVNFYDAISGYLNKNDEKVKQSNIEELIKRLEDISATWEDTFKESLEDRFRNTLDYGKRRIEEKIASIDKTQEQLFEERKRLQEQYEKETDEIKRLLKEAKNELYDEEDSVDAFITEITEDYTGQLRARTHQIIDKGITDGERLTKAFNDYQREQADLVYEAIVDKTSELKVSIEKKLERFGRTVSQDLTFAPSFIDFRKESAFKFEKGLEVIMDAGGGVGGIYAGMAVSAKMAAAGGALAGPVGVVAGFLAGAVVSLAVGAVAHKTKRVITQKRGKVTKTEIEVAIMGSRSEIKKALRDTFNDFFTKVRASFDDILSTRKEQYQKKVEDLANPVKDLDKKEALEELKFIASVLDKTR